MRHDPDHPRTWAELEAVLTDEERLAFKAYLSAEGLPDPAELDACTIERCYTDWRHAGA